MRSPKHLRRIFLNPIQDLAAHGKLSGILLILATILSLVLSNIQTAGTYLSFWQMNLSVPGFSHSVLFWINDGLMPFFFFLVGIEIKRELLNGELSTVRQAILPAVAALGGMIVPAAIYLSLNLGNPETVHGWAIPTATDIAFSLGILSLLGKRIPFALKVFLTALAIIDDLGAILIIAVFYTSGLQVMMLLVAGLLFAGLIFLNLMRVRSIIPFIVLGAGLWYFILQSGIHPTIAGVMLALTIPVKMSERFETRLHGPVYYFILPLFALANTAIPLSLDLSGMMFSTLSLGIMAGLFIGKPLGIFLTTFLLVKTKVSSMLRHVTWMQMVGLGLTAGIGFTMSIFISTLSFRENDFTSISKLAIIAGSLLSAIAGMMVLRFAPRAPGMKEEAVDDPV